MVKTASTMLPLGALLPRFSLPDVTSGEVISDRSFVGKKGLCVMFICSHCPFVIHVKPELARLGRDFENQDVALVAISSNDAGAYPQDAPAQLAQMADDLGFTFPYLYDETQETAKAFTAACTPDFFLFDAQGTLIYRGQLDDSRPGNGVPLDGRDLRAAIENLLAGTGIDSQQKPSIGCNIKWKPGGEPDYFGTLPGDSRQVVPK
jgi:peroxiredoxin